MLIVGNFLVVQWVGLVILPSAWVQSLVFQVKPSAVAKKKKKKELLTVLCSFTLGKLMRDLEYKASEYLGGTMAEVCKLSCEGPLLKVSTCFKRKVFV